LKTTGQVPTLALASPLLLPSRLAANSPNETIGVGCIGLGTRGGDHLKDIAPLRGAFIETATFLMSVESYKRKRMVRWDPVKEDIVEA
jgi:hypothetical protein